LQERSHFDGGVDLDDSVEIPYINPQFQRTGSDDDTIASLLERLFRAKPLVPAQ
jgi:hypothetical protein